MCMGYVRGYAVCGIGTKDIHSTPLAHVLTYVLTYLLTSRTLINVVVQDSEDYRMKERVSE